MRTIAGLFDTYDHAGSAVRAVSDAGIPADDISLVAGHAGAEGELENPVHDGIGTGAQLGMAAGGGLGFFAGLGTLAIPGIGPVLAGGWLLGSAIGAIAGAGVGGAAGGLIGAMANAGISEEEAHVHAEGVRRGGAVVTVRVADERADAIAAILRNAGAVDLDQRRADYHAEGWRGFDETAPRRRPGQLGTTTIPPL